MISKEDSIYAMSHSEQIRLRLVDALPGEPGSRPVSFTRQSKDKARNVLRLDCMASIAAAIRTRRITEEDALEMQKRPCTRDCPVVAA